MSLARHSLRLGLGFGLLCFCLLTFASLTPAAADLTSDCKDLLTHQWEALAKGDHGTANKVLDRARGLGCLGPPIASELCGIPAEQEMINDEKGNVPLVNMARNQQRLLGCPM